MQLQTSTFACIYKLNRLVVTLRKLQCSWTKTFTKNSKILSLRTETQKYSQAGFNGEV